MLPSPLPSRGKFIGRLEGFPFLLDQFGVGPGAHDGISALGEEQAGHICPHWGCQG